MAPGKSLSVEVYGRPPKVACKVVSKPMKNLPVVRSGSSKCHYNGRTVGATTSSTGALEVICLSRRDITHEHSVKAADVDAEL